MSSKLEGITWHAQGEANFYRLMRGNDWVAIVQFNGELLVWDQEQLLNAMLQGQQAAPVGEREAFEAHIRAGGHDNPAKHPDGSYVSSVMELWWQGWKARAAYQRQSGVVMPDVSAMAKVLSDRAADACNIDRTDNWAMYGQEYIDDVQAMLEVARLNGAKP